MKTKTICVMFLLALGFLAATASADQSCKFILSSTSKIGTAELQPGEYRLVVDEKRVVLTELKTGKLIELEAKIEQTEQKANSTQVHSQQVDGVSRINEIRIGGSKTKVAFN
jgi:hypothetical protein